jgi:hypothetical protein
MSDNMTTTTVLGALSGILIGAMLVYFDIGLI